MLQIAPRHVKRVSFASRIFPKLKSSPTLQQKSVTPNANTDHTIGINSNNRELFFGGISKNKDLLTFFGALWDPANGCKSFGQLPIFCRSIKKLTELVEQELECIGGQQVLLPTLVPQKLWAKSQRLQRQPNALDSVYKLEDKDGLQLLLGPTFEEYMTCLAADLHRPSQDSNSLLLYQTSTKFRLESRPRFGLIRSNEFIMNDSYSFDLNLEKALQTYETVGQTYDTIFKRLSLKCLKVESDPGDIGGRYSHEYQLPLESGEDAVILCGDCGHSINSDMITMDQAKRCLKCGSENVTSRKTLELGHTFLLSDVYSKPLGAYASKSDTSGEQFLEMGCYGLGLTRILAAAVDYFAPQSSSSENHDDMVSIRWPSEVEPYKLAIVMPATRSKQTQAGSTEFTSRMITEILESTQNVDILVEDIGREPIGKKIRKVQSLGIPNLMILGGRFLQDPPEIEFQVLNEKKDNYDTYYFTEGLALDFIKKLDR